ASSSSTRSPIAGWSITRSVVHVGEPGGMSLGLTLGRGEERSLQLLGDRTAVPLAHGSVVDLADRRDLGRRAREEALVRVVQVGADKVLLGDLVGEVARERDHGLARDPVEASG